MIWRTGDDSVAWHSDRRLHRRRADEHRGDHDCEQLPDQPTQHVLASGSLAITRQDTVLSQDERPCEELCSAHLHCHDASVTERISISPARQSHPMPLPQLSHRCTHDSSKAAENCGVPKPPPICGAKNRCPSEGLFVLTGSTTVCWHSRRRKAFRPAGRRKSRLCRDFRSAASPKLPYQPQNVWCLKN
jgi:hypothetical protein